MRPKAVRVAVLINPASDPSTGTTLRDAQDAARIIGLQIQILNATTIGEIDAAFATFARERPDAYGDKWDWEVSADMGWANPRPWTSSAATEGANRPARRHDFSSGGHLALS